MSNLTGWTQYSALSFLQKYFLEDDFFLLTEEVALQPSIYTNKIVNQWLMPSTITDSLNSRHDVIS